MKILLSNHALQNLGGSETWVRTMYGELAKQHEVHVYTPQVNTLFPWMQPFDGGPYDLALINHRICLSRLAQFDLGKRVFTSHGVIPGAEKPEAGADVYVAVSEEVQARLASDGFESFVIRNPIDTEYFRQSSEPSSELGKVLFLSNNPRNRMSTKLSEAAREHGVHLTVAGREDKVEDTRSAMNESDMVFGLGRSAYEAMSMSRNVTVFDYNGADGDVTPESVREFRKSNCSGRRYRLDWSVADIIESFERYEPDRGVLLRQYIKENNNVKDVAEQYLCL